MDAGQRVLLGLLYVVFVVRIVARGPDERVVVPVGG